MCYGIMGLVNLLPISLWHESILSFHHCCLRPEAVERWERLAAPGKEGNIFYFKPLFQRKEAMIEC